MKPAALSVFACPACKGPLQLRADRQDGEDVVEGQLACAGCAATYPIVRSVPRFVASGSYAASFGRQWSWFRQVQIDSANGTAQSAAAFCGATGWQPGDLRERRVLDAGVGAGRFAECAAAAGAEVYGVDLTLAVDAAQRNVGRLPNVHLAQADIFALPFRDATFDRAYSIGVLHHTPDPPAAFARVSATVRPGGELAVYVYHRYGWAHRSSDMLRVVTTRLPPRLMFALSAAAVPLYFAYRLPLVGGLLRLSAPISMLPNWRWRWLDTFDWYTPKYQWKYLYPEVFQWFARNGFRDVAIFDDPIRMRGMKDTDVSGHGAGQYPRLVAS